MSMKNISVDDILGRQLGEMVEAAGYPRPAVEEQEYTEDAADDNGVYLEKVHMATEGWQESLQMCSGDNWRSSRKEERIGIEERRRVYMGLALAQAPLLFQAHGIDR